MSVNRKRPQTSSACLVERRLGLDDVVARVGERVAGAADGGGDLRVRVAAGRVGQERDTAATSLRGTSSGTGTDSGSRGCMPATMLSPSRTSATRRAITPSTAINCIAGPDVLRRDHRRVRDAARRRLDRRDPAAVRGVAQRAADVVAQPERRHARGQRARLAAAGAARGHAPGPTGCASARAATSRCGCADRGRAGSCADRDRAGARAGARPAARRRGRPPRPARDRRRSSACRRRRCSP